MAPSDVIDVRSRLADRGPYYGWVVVGACFLGSFAVYGLVSSFGVFLGRIVAAFDLSLARASVVFSVQSTVIYGGGAALGFLVDRYSVRRLYALGALLLGAGLYGASQATSVASLVVWYGVVGGAGSALVVVIAYVTPPRWFTERRGLATGIAASGSGVGALTVPPFTAALVETFGWRGAYLTLAALAVGSLALAAVFVAEAPRVVDRTRSQHTEHRNAVPLRTQVADAATTMRSWSFVLFLVALATAYAPVLALTAHAVEFAVSNGFGRGVGVAALSIVGVGDVFGKFSVGHVSDRLPLARVTVIAGCVAGLGLAIAGLVVAPVAAVVLGLAAAFGVCRGGVGALATPVLVDVFGSDNLSSLYGVSYVGLAVSGALVPYLVGLSYDVTGTFRVGFVGVGLFGLLAAGSFLAAARLGGSD